MADPTSCRLYLITPPVIDDPRLFAQTLREALDGGDVAVLQLRLKGADDDTVCRAADILRPVCQQREVAFIMNDRPDLAAKLDCDGVHVGQEDASYAEERRLMGADRIVGVTCHNSRHLAVEAADAGADYVAFGAFFPTATKEAKTRAPIDIVGSGSFLPASWSETYATADIVEYEGVARVKVGREFLHRRRPAGSALA